MWYQPNIFVHPSLWYGFVQNKVRSRYATTWNGWNFGSAQRIWDDAMSRLSGAALRVWPRKASYPPSRLIEPFLSVGYLLWFEPWFKVYGPLLESTRQRCPQEAAGEGGQRENFDVGWSVQCGWISGRFGSQCGGSAELPGFRCSTWFVPGIFHIEDMSMSCAMLSVPPLNLDSVRLPVTTWCNWMVSPSTMSPANDHQALIPPYMRMGQVTYSQLGGINHPSTSYDYLGPSARPRW